MQEIMSSRDRLTRTLSYQPTDRVPIDLGGFQSGIHLLAYKKLMEFLKIKDEISILDPIQQLARPCEELLERFRVDTRYLTSGPSVNCLSGIKRNTRGGRMWQDLTDDFGVIWSMPEDQQLYMDISQHPLANASLDDLKNYPFPSGNDPSRFAGLRRRALELRKETPYAICTGIGGMIYEYCWFMRGMQQWYIDMLTNPEFCEILLDRLLEFWKDYYTCFLAEVGDLVDVVMTGDDLTGQNGPLFSPEFYRRIVKPRQKGLLRHIKSLTQAKVWYHICGNCNEYVLDLVDNGVDILNPVQISATDMDPQALKERYDKKIIFWGGSIDPQHVLPSASPDEITRQARKNISIFKTGGGYVFSCCHNIQADVPPENIVALYDAAYEYGFYKKV